MSKKLDPEVQKYVDILKGKRVKGYFGKNLIIIENGEKSIEERTKDDISPPLNYNREYSEPLRKEKTKASSKASSSKQGQTRARVDPQLMREFLR